MSRAGGRADATALILDADTSLLEVVDNLLTKGVVVTGEVVLGLAGVDLVYLRLSAHLCAADRLTSGAPTWPPIAPDARQRPGEAGAFLDPVPVKRRSGTRKRRP